MVNARRNLSILALGSSLVCAPQVVHSFGVQTQYASRQRLRSAYSTRVLQAKEQQQVDNQAHGGNRRRGFLGNLGKAALSGIVATASIFHKPLKPAMAVAADYDSVPTLGRMVQVEVANLNGIEGNMGTFKIQLRPEWAPRGARRFEVSVSCAMNRL
jgi:hypothetical protein